MERRLQPVWPRERDSAERHQAVAAPLRRRAGERWTRRHAVSTGVAGGTSALLAGACGLPSGGRDQTANVLKKPATVRYLTRPGNVTPEIFEPWIASWNATYPNIKVDVSMSQPTPVKQEDKAKLLALVAAGDPPDVSGPWEGAWSMVDIAQSVDDLVQRDRYDVTRFQQTTFNSAKYEGKVYTLPYAYGGNGLLMAYNRKLFAESGVPQPGADWRTTWTWNDFREALRRTTRRDGDQLTQVGLGAYGYFLSTIPTPWGGTWLSDDRKTVVTDAPQMLQAYTSYLDLVYGDRTTFQSPGLAQGSAKPTFVTGKAAVTSICCGIARNTKPYDDAGLDWAFAPFPRGTGAPAANDMITVHLALTKGARARDAGWAFMKWCVEEGRAASVEGRIPPMPALVDKWAKDMFSGRSSVRPEVLQSALNYTAIHWINHHPALQTVVYPYVDPWWADVLAQKVNVRDALLAAKRELQLQLDDFMRKLPKP